MTVRGGRIIGWCLACLVQVACSTPTLWVGTAGLDNETPTATTVSQTGPELGVSEPVAGAGASSTGAAAPAQGGTDLQASMGMSTRADAGMRQGGAGSTSVLMAADADAGVDDAAVDLGSGSATRPSQTQSEPRSPVRLPAIEGECPDLSAGSGTYTFRASGRSLSVDLYLKPAAARQAQRRGPLVLYFHAFGSGAGEVTTALSQASIDSIVAAGGVVAAFDATPCLRCGLANDLVWYDEDDPVSDQVVACAIAQAQVDTRRIHAVGFSAGALHVMHLALARSDYLASVVSYSGGTPLSQPEPQDPMNKLAALLVFGRAGVDNALADFNIASHDWYDTYVPRGYYVLLCDHDGGHMIPADLAPHVLRFLRDHPYRVQPEPYLPDLPSEFPSYCQNGPMR